MFRKLIEYRNIRNQIKRLESHPFAVGYDNAQKGILLDYDVYSRVSTETMESYFQGVKTGKIKAELFKPVPRPAKPDLDFFEMPYNFRLGFRDFTHAIEKHQNPLPEFIDGKRSEAYIAWRKGWSAAFHGRWPDMAAVFRQEKAKRFEENDVCTRLKAVENQLDRLKTTTDLRTTAYLKGWNAASRAQGEIDPYYDPQKRAQWKQGYYDAGAFLAKDAESSATAQAAPGVKGPDGVSGKQKTDSFTPCTAYSAGDRIVQPAQETIQINREEAEILLHAINFCVTRFGTDWTKVRKEDFETVQRRLKDFSETTK